MSDSAVHHHLVALVKHNPAAALTFIADQLEPSQHGSFADLVTLNLNVSDLLLLLSAARRALYMLELKGDVKDVADAVQVFTFSDSAVAAVLETKESNPASALSFLSDQLQLPDLTDNQRYFIVNTARDCVDLIERISLFGEKGGNYAA